MADQLFADARLSELEERATVRLLTAEVFDEAAFSALLTHLKSRAEDLREHPSVPKQYLNALLSAVSAIRSRAEYMPVVRSHLPKAKELEMLLALVAKGESPAARQPGVPRII